MHSTHQGGFRKKNTAHLFLKVPLQFLKKHVALSLEYIKDI